MRVVIAAVVGGVVIFGWGAVSHMVLPLGTMGLSVMPDEERDCSITGAYFWGCEGIMADVFP